MNKMDKCQYCGADIVTVKQDHEVNGHRVSNELRYDIIQDKFMCEDCIDDCLENL